MTHFSQEQVADLNAKLDAKHVKQRTQAGRSLSYVEGWHAIAEANRIFGHDGWCSYTDDLRQLGEPREIDGKWRVAWMAKVRIVVGPVIREGVGYGSGIDRDLGSAHESAVKEAETDARKRGLMTFGWPFGLALYDKAQEHVEKDGPAETPAASDKRTTPTPDRTPAPVQSETPRGWAYITIEGEVVREPVAKSWFDRLEADVRRLPPAKSNKVWALNEKMAREVLESLGATVRPKGEAHLDRIMTLVSENASPVTA